MNGPLLATLLPPDRVGEITGSAPEFDPFVGVVLLIGFLLSFFLRHPQR